VTTSEEAVAEAIPGSVGSKAAIGDAYNSTFSRFGTSWESPTRLGNQAAAAEATEIGVNRVAGLHGVSVTQATPKVPASSATLSEIEGAGFSVVHTPTTGDPLHHTLILPKPVTPEVAQAFNRCFGRTK
jgi:hypothetical protein